MKSKYSILYRAKMAVRGLADTVAHVRGAMQFKSNRPELYVSPESRAAAILDVLECAQIDDGFGHALRWRLLSATRTAKQDVIKIDSGHRCLCGAVYRWNSEPNSHDCPEEM